MEELVGCVDFDYKKVIDIAPESCNIPKISVDPVNIKADYLDLQVYTDDKAAAYKCNPSGYQPQNTIDAVQIKHEVHSDSDVEVDLAYRIIDTFNTYEENKFKQEDENMSQNTEKSLKIRHLNDHTSTHIKVEVDDQTDIETDLDYTMNTSIVCNKKDISLDKDYVNYDNIKFKNDLNTNIAEQQQSKGM